MHQRGMAAAIIGALLLATTGCGTRAEFSEEMSAAFTQVSDGPQGTVVELASVTNWEWDTVSVFTEGMAAETVLTETGYDIGDQAAVWGTLLVFRQGDEVVKVIKFAPDSLWPSSFDQLTYDYPGYIEHTQIGPTIVTAPGEVPPPTP